MSNTELDDRVMSEETKETSKSRLFKLCMRGEWGKVVDTYEKDKMAHRARITSTGDTALHHAVTDDAYYIVRKLVKLICSEALAIQNERGNTALHLAASMGSVEMCECIASAEPSLLTIRNVDGETPLFLAALHGSKAAFLCLHYLSITDQMDLNNYSMCRRIDGDTILHSAIAGDFFDLAFQIIHLYGYLVNSVNESGFTPLHLLANKPSVFRSGNRLGRFEAIIYHAVTVKELKVATRFQQQCPTTGKEINIYPNNYQTCMDLLKFIKIFTLVVNPFKQDQNGTERDLEASKWIATTNGAETNSPVNYQSCGNLCKLIFKIIKTMLSLFGTEPTIRNIIEMKEKNVWSGQIMDELLKRASMYEYDDDGKKPPQKLGDKGQETDPYSFDEGGNVTLNISIIIKIMAFCSSRVWHFFPINNVACFSINETTKGSANINEIRRKKEKDKLYDQIMDYIPKSPPMYEYDDDGNKTLQKMGDKGDDKYGEKKMLETPVLIAAKNGVTEMVEKILELYPVAVHDMDAKKKNIVLLAIENRQIYLYKNLLNKKSLRESTFREVDSEGNTALHLAAKLGNYKPWLVSGDALQMHCEWKWYLFVRNSMPSHFFRYKYNNENKTPIDIFIETHGGMVRAAEEWQKRTSECSSVVAALIATVAFSTSTNVPGGFQEGAGTPILEDRPEFRTFAISSLVALCCSVASMVCFLSILTSRYQDHDFCKTLPWKLIFSLTLLYVAITSSIVSFCAGHFYVDKLGSLAFPVYAILCLSMAIFALSQFPLYIDLIRASKKAPERDQKTFQ